MNKPYKVISDTRGNTIKKRRKDSGMPINPGKYQREIMDQVTNRLQSEDIKL